MRRFPTFVLLVFLVFAAPVLLDGCAQDRASTLTSAADYYPLAVSDKWTYKMSPGTLVYDAQITATRTLENTTTYAMAVQDSYSFLAVKPDGIYEYGQGEPGNPQNAVVFTPPQLVYKLPAQVGDQWETPVLAEPESKKSETVYVDGQVNSIETVSVPAGVFKNCLKITIDDPRDAPADRTDLWLAPNVEIVKTVTYISIGAGKPKTTTTELVKYKIRS